jgi:hypothetical protein
MSETLTTEDAFECLLDIRGYSRAILAAIPGAAVLVFDLDLRVHLAEVDEFRRVGLDIASIEGQLLPHALPATAWAKLRRPYEGALAGRTSTITHFAQETLYSTRVSPLAAAGAVVGGSLWRTT